MKHFNFAISTTRKKLILLKRFANAQLKQFKKTLFFTVMFHANQLSFYFETIKKNFYISIRKAATLSRFCQI